ncbi:MAG: 3-oxoacyl-ACP synthase, partial [Prevotella sp.]|nr:3-oxoacyl-ACP synthase [Prevotella sp.]
YPKFYKMDSLSRLGFVASELLLEAEGRHPDATSSDRAVVLFNHSSSVQADKAFQASIQDPADYFPSPAAFVYTLPNIVAGEISIRNHYQGETSFYVLPAKDERMMEQVVGATFNDEHIQSVLGGWLDYQDDTRFEADLFIVENQTLL